MNAEKAATDDRRTAHVSASPDTGIRSFRRNAMRRLFALAAVVLLVLTGVLFLQRWDEKVIPTVDGSTIVIEGEPSAELSGFSFFVSIPEFGGRRLVEIRGSSARSLALRESASLEAELTENVSVWMANRQAQPLFLAIERGDWTAWLFAVTSEERLADDDFRAIGNRFYWTVEGGSPVIGDVDLFQLETYFTVPLQGRITVRSSRCLNELVDGASVVESTDRGPVIRAPGYASWCVDPEALEVVVRGDQAFVDATVETLMVEVSD